MADFSPYVPLSEDNLIEDKSISSAPQRVPNFTEHRSVSGAIDSGDITTRGWGMVMSEFKTAVIRVVPGTTANITVEARFWSEDAGKFISANPALQQAGAGAGIPFDYTVEVNGKILFVYVTGTIGNGAKIQIAGVDFISEP